MLTCGKAAAAAGIALAVGAAMRAQAPPEAVPAGTRVAQQPLSGRTGQQGGVTMNNGAVQVTGAFQGSVPSSQASTGALALSLDEAVRRGLQYNLGTVGFQQLVRQAQGMEQ